jgi:uncharacterized protein
MPPAIVASLHIYPIKGCGGLDVEVAEATPRGFAGDRAFMLVTPEGEFITQRDAPNLALARIGLEAGVLGLDGAGLPHLTLPIRREGPRLAVRVWRDTCQAIDQGEEGGRWFSRLIGRPCRLVRKAEDDVRKVDPEYAIGAADEVSFADGYPFLIVSRESLEDLNRRLADPLPMNRFRPSLVVQGWGEPFYEDRARRLRIGQVEIALVKPCARCEVTTIDQESARRGKEPLTTLATFRRRNGKVMFGQNGIPLTLGTIQCGDPVQILA